MSTRLTDEQLLGAGGEGVVLYRADLHTLTGDVNASLFLSQTLYWWVKMGRRPFYKYAAPCDSARPGDSWQEELRFNRYQFETARKKVAARCYTGDSKTALLEEYLVIYWVDRYGRTWYEVNEELLARRLHFAPDAEVLQQIANAETQQPIETVEVEQPITAAETLQPIESETTDTETTEKDHSLNSDLIFTPVCELFDDTDAAYTPAQIWQAVMGELRLQMDSSVFRWVENTRIAAIEGESFVIRIANRYARELFERCLPSVARTVEDIAGRKIALLLTA